MNGAERKARARARLRADGGRVLQVDLSKEARSALEALATVYGSQRAAVEAALIGHKKPGARPG